MDGVKEAQATELVAELRQMAATGYAGCEIWREAADTIERMEFIQRDFHNIDDVAEIGRLTADLALAQGLAADRNVRIALIADERDRAVERARQAAIILATALAGGGLPEQAHWMHDAAVWLNDRPAPDVSGCAHVGCTIKGPHDHNSGSPQQATRT